MPSEVSTARHGTAQNGTEWHGTAQKQAQPHASNPARQSTTKPLALSTEMCGTRAFGTPAIQLAIKKAKIRITAARQPTSQARKQQVSQVLAVSNHTHLPPRQPIENSEGDYSSDRQGLPPPSSAAKGNGTQTPQAKNPTTHLPCRQAGQQASAHGTERHSTE